MVSMLKSIAEKISTSKNRTSYCKYGKLTDTKSNCLLERKIHKWSTILFLARFYEEVNCEALLKQNKWRIFCSFTSFSPARIINIPRIYIASPIFSISSEDDHRSGVPESTPAGFYIVFIFRPVSGVKKFWKTGPGVTLYFRQ